MWDVTGYIVYKTNFSQVIFEKHMKNDFDVKSVENAMVEAVTYENILKLFILDDLYVIFAKK